MDSLVNMTDAELFKLKQQMETNISTYNTLQSSFKVLANSLYGALGCPYFRFYDCDMATSITLSGQVAINTVETCVNNYGVSLTNKENPAIISIAGDTDSLYLSIENLVKLLGDSVDESKLVDVIDKFAGDKLQGVISNGVKTLTIDTNAYDNKLYMKRESIAKAVLCAPKKYLFKVYDNEGVRYATPELKVTGLESQRSSTPAWVRKRLKTAYTLFFDGDQGQVQAFVKKTRNDYFNEDLSELIAASSANNMNKFIIDGAPIKGTPAHIKASHAYNQLIIAKGLSNKYQLIKSGDKVKVCVLKMPNPTKVNTIAFSDKIPPEFGLEQFVDREFMFNKFFLEPLQRVAEVLQWNCEKKFKLEL